jgi:hypothetical protein
MERLVVIPRQEGEESFFLESDLLRPNKLPEQEFVLFCSFLFYIKDLMKSRAVELTLLPLLRRPAHEPVGEVPVGHLLGGLLHRDERRGGGRRRRGAVGRGESGRVVRRRGGRRRRQALHAEALLHGHGRGPHVQLHPEQPHAPGAVAAAGPRVVAVVPTARALPSHGREAANGKLRQLGAVAGGGGNGGLDREGIRCLRGEEDVCIWELASALLKIWQGGREGQDTGEGRKMWPGWD